MFWKCVVCFGACLLAPLANAQELWQRQYVPPQTVSVGDSLVVKCIDKGRRAPNVDDRQVAWHGEAYLTVDGVTTTTTMSQALRDGIIELRGIGPRELDFRRGIAVNQARLAPMRLELANGPSAKPGFKYGINVVEPSVVGPNGADLARVSTTKLDLIRQLHADPTYSSSEGRLQMLIWLLRE